MKKRILLCITLTVIFLASIFPVCATALTPLDPDEPASLTLHYQKDGMAFENLEIGIYRVAEAFPDGTFRLTEPFLSESVDIYDITQQAQWNTVAQTLYSAIVANQIKPDREVLTDEKGVAHFSGVQTGLYFVREVVAENAQGTYVFNQFMVYLPTPQPDGTYQYNAQAYPKCTGFVPKTQYSVTKLWQDGGDQSTRPREVTVAIYKDGVLQQTRPLNAENNWSYEWTVSGDDTGIWTVAEQSVPNGYQVAVSQNGSHFSLINTYKTTSDIPNTGDSFIPLPWILGMCVSGIALVILGIYNRRRK